jgi:hypothetical protein
LQASHTRVWVQVRMLVLLGGRPYPFYGCPSKCVSERHGAGAGQPTQSLTRQETLHIFKEFGLQPPTAQSVNVSCLHCFETLTVHRAVYLDIHVAACERAPREERMLYASHMEFTKSLGKCLGSSKVAQVLALAAESRLQSVATTHDSVSTLHSSTTTSATSVSPNTTSKRLVQGYVRRSNDRSFKSHEIELNRVTTKITAITCCRCQLGVMA